jgi:ABC-type transporter Mla subunit MlaD
MKAQDRSNYVIAIGVIVCGAILLGALTFALTGFSWSKGGRTVAVEFHDATGINLHSPVKYAGKTAGTVSEIRYLTAEERAKGTDPQNAVRVTLSLHNDVPPLLEDVSASLSAETLLGEKFVALTPGKPDSRTLSNNAVIQGASVTSIDAVAGTAKEAIEKVNDILASVKADYPALIPRLAELLSQGNAILGKGSNVVNNVDVTILNANSAVTKLKADYNELIPKISAIFGQAQNIATNADQAVLKVSSLIDRLDGVVTTNEADIAKLVGELRVASQNLKIITTYAKALTATLAEKPSNLIWSRRKRDLPTEKAILESAEPVPIE